MLLTHSVSEVIIQVDVCLEPMGRTLRDRELKVIVAQLEDCAQAKLLMFMMSACMDPEYLDKVRTESVFPQILQSSAQYSSNENEILHVTRSAIRKYSFCSGLQTVECVLNKEDAMIVRTVPAKK